MARPLKRAELKLRPEELLSKAELLQLQAEFLQALGRPKEANSTFSKALTSLGLPTRPPRGLSTPAKAAMGAAHSKRNPKWPIRTITLATNRSIAPHRPITLSPNLIMCATVGSSSRI